MSTVILLGVAALILFQFSTGRDDISGTFEVLLFGGFLSGGILLLFQRKLGRLIAGALFLFYAPQPVFLALSTLPSGEGLQPSTLPYVSAAILLAALSWFNVFSRAYREQLK